MHRSLRSRIVQVVAVVFVVLIASCGGGGGEGSSGPGDGGATNGVRLHVTVSGLKGDSAVLSLNGGQDQAVLAAQTDVFWTNVPKKTAYAITVKHRPVLPWQSCVIGNGTGTANGDVENITMTCTTDSYAVGGSVTGQAADGLVIQFNQGNAKTITTGTNSFSWTGIPSMTDWTVSVSSDPAGQRCVVGNASGRVEDKDNMRVAITCGAKGFVVSGGMSGVGADGLALSLNGGPDLSLPSGYGGPGGDFAFPATMQSGSDYSIVVTKMPNNPFRQSCGVARGKGRVGTADVTNVAVNCRANGTLVPLEGTYIGSVGTKRGYLTLWAAGIYSDAIRTDDATCPNNGNGTEYGVYRHPSDDSFVIFSSYTDRNGGCGFWDSQATPQVGLNGKIARTATKQLLLTFDNQTLTLDPVANDPAKLLGSFTRADGIDGSFVVFEADGTYLYNEAQDAPSTGNFAGFERGCYTVSGNTFTVSFAASCKPNGSSALDLNNRAGFSATAGAIPFQITSDTTATIAGTKYRRILPK
ncbi:MAG: hypothetical protein U0164_21590 [Gemmatimonadaceae bacterium]